MKSSFSPRLNAELLDRQYASWSADPNSVDALWAAFFEGFELGVAQPEPAAEATPAAAPALAEDARLVAPGELDFRAKITTAVYQFRALGHTQANINPLNDDPERNPNLKPSALGFSEQDLERDAASAFFHHGEHMKLRDLLRALEDTYCGPVGFQFVHINNTAVRYWMQERIEQRVRRPAPVHGQRVKSLRWLMEAEMFESFLGRKFLGEKRFSIEGGEGALIILNAILGKCPTAGVREIEMGMSHRGRLNVLANFVKKSLETILYEFTPEYEPDLVAGDGDVKYHLGYESVREVDGATVRVSLAANPSHLEAVNPVVQGKARARQRVIADDEANIDRGRVLPLLLHGDAAFAGQGSVAELLNLSQLPGYRTGGTIHLIVNNQIGFTTMPADARSSAYATDVAKMIEAPILHVNGEKPDELWWAAEFALEFRQRYGRDIIIDMYCYRRQGHNETDQAAFTSPLVAKQIAARKPLSQLYRDELLAAGVVSADEAVTIEREIRDRLEAGYERMSAQDGRTSFSGSTAVEQPAYHHGPVATGAAPEIIAQVGRALTDIPAGFHLHPTLAKRFVPRRADALAKGEGIDWALAEALSWGSLLAEGLPVRLSGQDCGRGTFSQRHVVFHDHENGDKYIPLEHVCAGQARFCVHNSLLSEFAVLGFDYGYSRCAPHLLVMWEAQFGDFANGAQVIIDQFIASAESKWQTPSDIVLLLPHGYDGQGPEHSSARLERFLQLCAEDNMIVANLTTPAQYFHALRRQKKRDFRKPLVLMTPKSLLTRPEAVSALADFLPGTCFQEVLPDIMTHGNPDAVKRVVFCSGKVFYDLVAARAAAEVTDTAILRVEQLYPLHREMVEILLGQYPAAETYVWCQEEPANMGAWTYLAPCLREITGGELLYAGRDAAASPAAGSKAVHYREQKAYLKRALGS